MSTPLDPRSGPSPGASPGPSPARDPDMGVYVISVAAELAGIHAQTLRTYERKGLLDPARTPGGDRRYSENDLARVQRICAMSDEGVSIAGMRRILELQEENARLHAEIEALRSQLG